MSTKPQVSGSSGARSVRPKTLRKRAITHAMDRKEVVSRTPELQALPAEVTKSAEAEAITAAESPTQTGYTTACSLVSSANEIEEELDKLGIPRPNPRTDDDWSDADSICSRRSDRRSSILPSFAKRTGISMDLASQRANELLQMAKEALEKAGNMKRECKLDALESLQEMYEIVLSVSDSRSRHRVSLEQERARAAKELVRVERAHSKQLAEMNVSHASKLKDAHEVILTTHETAESIRKWLSFELDGPIKSIATIQNELRKLSIQSEKSADACDPEISITKHSVEMVKLLMPMFEGVTDQVRTMRGAVDDLIDGLDKAERLRPVAGAGPIGSALDIESLHMLIKAEIANIKFPQFSEGVTKGDDPSLEVLAAIKAVREDIVILRNESSDSRQTGKSITQGISQLRTEVGESLDTIVETVGPVRTAVESLRNEVNERLSSQTLPAREAAAVLNPTIVMTHRPAMAQRHDITARRTVVVESDNTQQTSEDILGDIKKRVDVAELGVAVHGLRKGKNNKVMISVETDEDSKRMRSAIQKLSKGYMVTEPPPKFPQLKLIGVTNDMDSPKAIEAIRRQNRGTLDAHVDEHIKVLRRTKHRTECLSNIILEVSPGIWHCLVDQRVKIGYQVVRSVDQSPIRQCFNCLGFGHEARSCSNTQTCGYCAGKHDTRTCRRTEAPKCTNCKTDLDRSHPAYSDQCPEWRRYDRLARSVISYC